MFKFRNISLIYKSAVYIIIYDYVNLVFEPFILEKNITFNLEERKSK